MLFHLLIIIFVFGLLSLEIVEMADAVTRDPAGEDYCCIVDGMCYGPYDEFGRTFSDMGIESSAEMAVYCMEELDGDFRQGSACRELDECVTGCCVFYDGADWTENFPVGRASCLETYDDSFFDDGIGSQEECEAFFLSEEFNVHFNIVDSSGNQVDIDEAQSNVQPLADSETCNFDRIGGRDDYNYGVDCDGSPRLGFGTYRVNVVAQVEGETYTYEDNIRVSGEEVFEIELDLEAPAETIEITGQVFEYEEDPADGTLLETERQVPDATVTISGLNIQTSTGSDGRFTLTDVPVHYTDENSYYVRTITISAPGFHPWGENVEIAEDTDLGDIYLLEAEDTVAGKICCPNILGCAPGREGDSSCFAGSGQYGVLCDGNSPQEACNIEAPFCCASEKLCPEDQRSSAGGCRGQGCNVPCMRPVQCLADDQDATQVSGGDVCLCGSGNYIDDGYCCRAGDDFVHANTTCDDYGDLINVLVLAQERENGAYSPVEGATVFFRGQNGGTMRLQTGDSGTASTLLPPDTYSSNAYMTGYRAHRDVKRLEVDRLDDGFSTGILQSVFLADDRDSHDDVAMVEEKLGVDLDPGEHNLIFYLDHKVESCEWGAEATSIRSASANHVPGEDAVRVEWDFDDCLELRSFRVERKATYYTRTSSDISYDIEEGGWQVDEDRSHGFREVYRAPAGRTEFFDENVRWSSQIPTAEGLPAVKAEGDSVMSLGDDNDQSLWVYEYRITPEFAGYTGDTYEGDSLEIAMGDAVCEGRSGASSEFCAYHDSSSISVLFDGDEHFRDVLASSSSDRSAKLRALRTLRVACDSENRLKFTTDQSTYRYNCRPDRTDLDQSHFQLRTALGDDMIYTYESCVGPSNGRTTCEVRDDCRGDFMPSDRGAFGMLETLTRQTTGTVECYGDERGDRFTNACTLQPDTTISDRCVYCEEILDCSYYTSQESCEIDNCIVGNPGCRWINTSMSSAGEGVCVPEEIRPSESYCKLASRDNLPFQRNIGWSESLCAELGDCYSTYAGGCRDCSIIDECLDYRDEFECVGDPGARQNITISYPKPEDFELGHNDTGWREVQNTCYLPDGSGVENDRFYNLSNDGCGLGTCRWDGDRCIRDATANEEEDEAYIDDTVTLYPTLSPASDSDMIFSEKEGRKHLYLVSDEDLFPPPSFDHKDFSKNEFGFRFCIDQDDSCCPSLPRDPDSAFYDDMTKREVKISDMVNYNSIDEDGLYYVRFLAQGEHLNIAPLRSVEILVDTTPPNITIDVIEQLSPDPADDSVDLRFLVESIGENAHPDFDEELISCDFDLRTVRDGMAELGDHPQEDNFVLEHWVDYNVEPGLYEFTAECRDEAHNVVIEEVYVRADGAENLNVISPVDGGAIPDEPGVEFRIVTDYPSSCRISWPRADGGRDVEDLITDDRFNHRLPKEEVNLDSMVGEGPVYDDVFDVHCIEDMSHCTIGGEECDSDADCANGHCARGEKSHPITFVRDGEAPVTGMHPSGHDGERTHDISERRRSDQREISGLDYQRDGAYYYNNNVSIEFSCEGTAPDDDYPSLKAGCDGSNSTYYCIQRLGDDAPHAEERFCSERSTEWTSVEEASEIMEQRSFSICYYSVDEVGNREDTRCSVFYIHREEPDLDLSIDTEFIYDDSFVTDIAENTFSGAISAKQLENYDIHYLSSDDRGRTLLEVAAQNTLRTPDNYASSSEGGTISFSGRLPRLARVNSLGPNRLRLFAEDRYGNRATEIIYVYYDLEPPLLRDYEINDDELTKDVEYNEDLHFRFWLDDVFWTNEIAEVSVNVYAHDVGPFAGDFETGWMELEPTGVISEDEGSRTNMSEDISDYIRELYYYGTELNQDQERRRLNRIAEWKEYSFSIFADDHFNEELRLNDIGVGEYILEIKAVDPMGQEMNEHILFNVTDSTEPIITMHQPPMFRESGSDPGDSKVRITNNPNQEFIVETEQPSYCFFNLGTTPTQDNPMQEDENREIHSYILDEFQPFDRVTVPVTISCTVHGTDLHSDRFSLMFDRRPVRLAMDSSRGDLVPPSVNKDHIREFQLDYTQRRYGELKPVISVSDVSEERIIECTYECRSPNSFCSNREGTFPGSLSTSPAFSPTIIEEFGDYLYTITCNDQAGNIARARDLAFSVRDRGASRNLYILDDSYYPGEGDDQFSEDVEFGVSTTMLSFCSIVFTEGGIEDIPMSDNAALTHRKTVNMTEHTGEASGRYSYKFRCQQSTDRSLVQETEEMSFEVIDSFDEISGDMFEQLTMASQYVPVFDTDGLPSGITHIEYFLEGETLDDIRTVPNTGSLVIPELGPNEVAYVRGLYETGISTPLINITSSEDALSLTEADLEYARDGTGGQRIQTVSDRDADREFYPMSRDRIYISIRHQESIDDIRAILNGEPRGSNEYMVTSTMTEDSYTIGRDGMHDLFLLITKSDGRRQFLHLPISRSEEAPQIESIEPRFLRSDRVVNVSVSRPAECSVVYPSSGDDRQLIVRSTGASTFHEFELADISMSGRRHEGTQISVYCNDNDDRIAEQEHMLQIATEPPRVLEITSDNSILNSTGGSNYVFTSVRDEDVHITANTDEYSRCTYRDPEGNVREFNDYFLPNLYPHASLDVGDGSGVEYLVECENEAGISARQDYSITVYNNPEAPLFLHDAYPDGMTGERFPQLEVYTFREAECQVDIHEEAEDTNIFFRVLNAVMFSTSSRMESDLVGHRYRHTAELSAADRRVPMGLQEGNIYRATITCSYAGDSASTDISFMYSPEADPRPLIYIE